MPSGSSRSSRKMAAVSSPAKPISRRSSGRAAWGGLFRIGISNGSQKVRRDASRRNRPPQGRRAGNYPQAAVRLSAMQTVLVVDDEPLIRWAVREGLEGAGYAVVEAGTAREALASLAGAAAPVTVALLDLRLPDSNDLALLRRVLRE